MSKTAGNLLNFLSESDGQFYLGDKCQSQTYNQGTVVYSTGNVSGNLQLPISNPVPCLQQDGQLVGLLENTPAFTSSSNPSTMSLHQHVLDAISLQNVSHSNIHSANSNTSQQSQQQELTPNYFDLTSWTTKFVSQGSPALPSTNVDTLQLPMMSGQQSNFPRTANTASLTSRMYKASPYHNSFSQMSPLHPSPGSKMKTVNGNQPDAMAAVLPMNSSGEVVVKMIPSRENRFKRTAEALQKSGLWEVAMKTGNLIKRNQELQIELEQFKMDALNFLKSVIKNPENRDFIKTVLNNALSARSTENKKSTVLTVVVSAAAAAAVAAATVKCESSTSTDSGLSTNNKASEMRSSNVSDKSVFSV